MFSLIGSMILPLGHVVSPGDEHAEGRWGRGSVGFLVGDEGFDMMKHDCVVMEVLAQYGRYLLPSNAFNGRCFNVV